MVPRLQSQADTVLYMLTWYYTCRHCAIHTANWSST